MAQYVVDASVIIEYLVTGPYTDISISFFDSVKNEDELIVPVFCRLECVNVLWEHVRFHGLPREQADLLLSDLIAMPLRVVPVDTLYVSAFDIGLAYELAIYDSIYITLAKNLSCPLITADRKQAQKAKPQGVDARFIDSV